MSAMVRSRVDDSTLHVAIDDQATNSRSLEILETLHALLRQAVDDPAARVVIIEGNARALSTGLDAQTVLAGGARAERLAHDMREILHLLYLSRLRSVVVGGDARGAGALLLLACDVRIGIGAAGRIGLPESGVGPTLAPLAEQLVRDRIDPAAQPATLAHGALYEPADALRVGFLDHLVDTREAAIALARAEAARLATLEESAYLHEKRATRHAYARIADRLSAT